jgi:hypothetical protein
MDPSKLIPATDPIPVSWPWFHVLLLLTFVLHLLFMNAMLGGGIIALVSHLRRKEQSPHLPEEISKKLPYTIAFTVNMGVAPLLFLQVLYGHFFYVSSILMAAYWISVIGALLLAYYSAYLYDFKYQDLGSLRALVIGFTVLILLAIGFLFSNNVTLMLQPAKWTAYFTRRDGTVLNLSDPALIPRYLHFVVASMAVGGLFVALLARFGRSDDAATRQGRIDLGLRWFSHATLAQVFIGLWFLMALPTDIMAAFMGKSLVHSGVFFAAIGGVVASLVLAFKKRLLETTFALLATVVLMVILRDLVRHEYLRPYFSPSLLEVVPQSSPLILFVVSFVVGLGLVMWMLFAASRVKTSK